MWRRMMAHPASHPQILTLVRNYHFSIVAYRQTVAIHSHSVFSPSPYAKAASATACAYFDHDTDTPMRPRPID